MLTHMLDTNICSFAVMGHPSAFRTLQEQEQSSWCISSLVLTELNYGLVKGKLSEASAEALKRFLQLAAVVPFDAPAAIAASQVRLSLEQMGKPSGAIDQLIAGHALSLNLTLVTDNTKHFESVPGLRLENWV